MKENTQVPKTWAHILFEEAKNFISKKLETLEEGENGYYFERSEIEQHLITTFPEASHGSSITGVLNKFLTGEYNIERIKRGYYLAINPEASLLASKQVLLMTINSIEENIIGANIDSKSGLTEIDIEMLTGMNLALKSLRAALLNIEQLEKN